MTFIVIEGIDGAGKSTQIGRLAKWITSPTLSECPIHKRRVLLTSESYSLPYLDKEGNQPCFSFHPPSPTLELWMFSMARVKCLEQTILPALKAGETVLCDRFTDSTIAYQCYGRKLPASLVEQLNSLATNGLTPDLTLVIDVDINIAMQRKNSRGNQSYLDQESYEFFTRVRQGYLDIVESNPFNHVLIDGNLPVDQVTEQVISSVQAKFAQISDSPSVFCQQLRRVRRCNEND